MNDAEQLVDERLDDLISKLERAAEQLRSGELSADAAATLVEDCAGAGGGGGGRVGATLARGGLDGRARPGLVAVAV